MANIMPWPFYLLIPSGHSLSLPCCWNGTSRDLWIASSDGRTTISLHCSISPGGTFWGCLTQAQLCTQATEGALSIQRFS
ncbi:hypothetical protein Micbo1qcDRAFT_74775 [Microdochium bolleyi]|uniref:Secreted protein n=1 Tax=Microdochium bolleyi TaxID=196109 RepID=A0A136IZ95_9PEZI|nr:hypothetical protein Micbo1qcDRAFT_74775 [Microdochium bolleyi]